MAFFANNFLYHQYSASKCSLSVTMKAEKLGRILLLVNEKPNYYLPAGSIKNYKWKNLQHNCTINIWPIIW